MSETIIQKKGKKLPDLFRKKLKEIMYHDKDQKNPVEAIEAEALTEANIEFLRARRSYLSAEEEKRYGKTLDASVEEEPTTAEEPKSKDKKDKKKDK